MSASLRPPPDPVYVLRGAKSAITALHYDDKAQNQIFSGTQDGDIHIWDMKSRRVVDKFNAHGTSTVLWICSLPDGRLVTQGRDGSVKVWERKQNSWTTTVSFQCSAFVFCSSELFVHGDETYIALPSDRNSTVEVLNIRTTKTVSTLHDSDAKYGMCMCMKLAGISSNQPLLLVGYESGALILWNILAEKVLDKLQVFPESLMCLNFSVDCCKGLCGSVNNKLVAIRVAEGKIIEDKTLEVTNEGFSAIKIRQDSKIAVTCGWDGMIRIFSVKSWKPLAVLSYHKGNVHCCTFTSEKLLVCGSKDKQISVWNIYAEQ